MAKINETNYPRRQASEYAPTDMLIVQPVPDPEQEHSGDSRTTRVSDLKEYMLGDADPSKIGTPAAGTYTSASNTNAQNIADLDSALGEKVDKISGKGLSTNDYTTEEKNKLAGIESEANKYSLPTASTNQLGGVKVGSGLEIENGVLSVSGNTDLPLEVVNGKLNIIYEEE